MGAHVSSFVVKVKHEVETHQLPELFVFPAKHLSEVGTEIEFGVRFGDCFVVTIGVVIYYSCNSRNFTAKI